MEEYRLYHRALKEFKDVLALSAQDACTYAGWLLDDVWVGKHTETRRDPHSDSGFRYPGWKNITPKEVKS